MVFYSSRGPSHFDRGTCVSLLLYELTAMRSAESSEMDEMRKRLDSMGRWIRVLHVLRYTTLEQQPLREELINQAIVSSYEELFGSTMAVQ
jgi:hypothetical protein